jgi:hypothetical protein
VGLVGYAKLEVGVHFETAYFMVDGGVCYCYFQFADGGIGFFIICDGLLTDVGAAHYNNLLGILSLFSDG